MAIPFLSDISGKSATFAGDVTLNTGTAKKLSILASTHNTNTAQTATLELGYTHSGGAAAGNIVLTEDANNSFGADMTFGVPHNNGSGGSTTRTALTLDGGTLSATFAGSGTFQNASGNTLTLKKGTGTAAIAFAGTATDPEASALIEGVAGGGFKIYTSNGGTIGTPGWSPKFTIAAAGNSTFAGNIDVQGNSATIGSSSQTTTTLNLTATNTAGSPANAVEVIMTGYEGRGIGHFYKDTSYSGQEWFSGLRYSGAFANWSVGYDASGGQAEYATNSLFTIYKTGAATFAGTLDIGGNTTATKASDTTIESKATTAGAFFKANSGANGYFGLELYQGTTAKWFVGSYTDHASLAATDFAIVSGNKANGNVRLKIDSSGNSTFAGDVTANGDGSFGTSGATNNSSVKTLDGSIITKIQSQTSGDTAGILGTESNNTLKLVTNNITALTVDTSQNATFAGDVTVNGGDFNLTKQNGYPTINMLWDGNNPSANTLLHHLNFQVDYSGSHQDWGGIEHRTTTGATRTKLNFNVKSTSGNVMNALSLDGTTDGTTATFAGQISASAGGFNTAANVNSTGDKGVSIHSGARLGFDQSGTRSWSMKADGGNLNVFSGDGNGGFNVSLSGGIITDKIQTRSGDLDINTVLTGRDVRFRSGNNTVQLRVKGDNSGIQIHDIASLRAASVTSATTTTTVSSIPIATYTAAFFDYSIKNGTNVRAGTVVATHDGTNVEFNETSTVDLGDTSDVTLSVDISSGDMRLRATTTSSTWTIKALIRGI